MNRSESIDQLAAALVKAQAKIEGAAKDRKGNYGTYATLASVVDACKPALLENGIGFVQTYEPADAGTLSLTTTLIHVSGQWVSGTCAMPLARNDPQGYGSASTYARRYGLAAMVGVCPEDDDGEGAMHKGANGRQQQPARAAQRNAAPKPAAAAPPAGDELADDPKFFGAMDRAFKARGFQPDQVDEAVNAVLRKKNVPDTFALGLDDRHAFIAAISEGKFDKYKALQPA